MTGPTSKIADRSAADSGESLECAYCGTAGHSDVVPQTEDDWADEAGGHSPDCEWVLTRAHTRDLPER